ncbi:heat shock protein Hsp15 [Yoonia maricola]|uniref:Heat shock protein Hsp15 n=1 Tax=Yoonia maricola TaxID=420999 RepID=A0A2M8WNA9_9RHOB|nr:RNA-binding S4 domain-containing protein [Yoonia maricola]PJI92420.1 heat shock protein Hsp15 [Yoonia maricola]
MTDPRPTIRLDKWLWHARFFKSRSLAAGVVTGGKVRVDSQPVSKPARAVGPGNVLTFVQADDTKVVRILACGERRGPAPEAQALYEDLTPAPKERHVAAKGANPRYEKGGRPTKKDRRDMGLD